MSVYCSVVLRVFRVLFWTNIVAWYIAWAWLFLLAVGHYEGPILVPAFFAIGIVVYHVMLGISAVLEWLLRLLISGSLRRSCAGETAPDRAR